MTVADYLIIAFVLINMLYGIMRGLFKEVISLSAWVLGIWTAFKYSSSIAPKLIPSIPFVNNLEFFQDSLWRQTILTGLLIFFAFSFLGAILNFIIAKISNKAGLGGLNRFLGMFFGLARGVLLVVVAAMFIENSPLIKEDPIWANAKLQPYAAKAAKSLESVLPDEILAYLPGRDESYGHLTGMETQELYRVLSDQGLDLTAIDLTNFDLSTIDYTKLDAEKLDPKKAEEYLLKLQRDLKKAAD